MRCNREATGQVVASDHEQALVLDTSFIGKSGRCTYGVDGYYAKVKFIDGVVDALGLDLVGKLRADATIRYRYNGPK